MTDAEWYRSLVSEPTITPTCVTTPPRLGERVNIRGTIFDFLRTKLLAYRCKLVYRSVDQIEAHESAIETWLSLDLAL